MSTTTKTKGDELLEEILAKPADADADAVDKPEEELDPSKIKQRKPPSRGMCRRCGENKPINRLMLCYGCWVISNLEEHGWREGQPHPSWCQCEGLRGHSERRSAGN
jgi:hypothetical protein